jgi:hypothetical protein
VEIVPFGNAMSVVTELVNEARRRAGGDYGVMPRPELGLPALRPFEEFVRCQSDVSRHLPKEDRRDVAAAMKRQGGLTPVWMPKLPVRTALPNQYESEALEQSFDLPWF